MNTSFFQELLGSIAERGRALIERTPDRQTADVGTASVPGATATAAPETLESLCRDLLSGRGEASGVALARQVLDLYAGAPVPARLDFFRLLARDFGPDPVRLRAAWTAYDEDPADPANLRALLRDVEPPRQELFRRLNLAPGGTAALVRMREDLLRHGGDDPGLHPRAHHPLRGGARDPGLGRPAPPRAAGGPALLRLLPPLDGRRAPDLRRGGADPRGPGLDPGPARRGPRGPAARARDHRRVLLDQQLPARS